MTTWPYIFTNQHRDELAWWNGLWAPQTVPSGTKVQVQLPATPVHWRPADDCPDSKLAGIVPASLLPLRAHVIPLDHSSAPNPGRMEGSETIAIFDYEVRGLGVAKICLRPDPVPDDPMILGFPTGTPPYFILTLIVGVSSL